MRALSYHTDVLDQPGPLTVRAVFERAWHLHAANGMVVTISTTPYDGPLGIRIAGMLPGDIQPGTTAHIRGTRLTVGPHVVDLSAAAPWNPLREPRPCLPLRPEVCEHTAPDPVVRARAEVLYDALVAADEAAIRAAVRGLIGLGPGLTPAGDDVLVGVLPSPPIQRVRAKASLLGERSALLSHVALSHAWARGNSVVGSQGGPRGDWGGPRGDWGGRSGDLQSPACSSIGVCFPPYSPPPLRVPRHVGKRDARDHHGAGAGDSKSPLRPFYDAGHMLVDIVVAEMAHRTTALSRTLLLYAARGVAVQPLLDVLWTGGEEASVARLVAIGHTSGRDMLAGAALAARLATGGTCGTAVVGST